VGIIKTYLNIKVMSEFKGNWEIAVENEIGTLISDKITNKAICTIWESGNIPQANSKLIACAPEMLDLLDRILKGKFNVIEIEQLIKKATS